MMGIEQSAISPFTDRVQRLKQLGGQFVNALNHPINTIESALGIPLGPQDQQQSHDAAIQQMNQQMNDQRVRDANQTYLPKPGLKMLKK